MGLRRRRRGWIEERRVIVVPSELRSLYYNIYKIIETNNNQINNGNCYTIELLFLAVKTNLDFYLKIFASYGAGLTSEQVSRQNDLKKNFTGLVWLCSEYGRGCVEAMSRFV